MKIQIIHLSDMHFENKDQAFGIQIDKMIQAINSVAVADECVIVISGDLANKGKKNEYSCVSSLVGAIIKEIGKKNYVGKKIEFICVPGNHDIDFENLTVTFEDIQVAYKNENIEEIVQKYLNNMEAYYNFSGYKKCFLKDKIVDKKIIVYEDKKIGFVMLNTAPLSLLKGNYEDMGSHFFSNEQLEEIENATEADINILVMHHSIEWFQGKCKDRLRNIISKKYSLVLTGHEHNPVGESRIINGVGEVQYVQGNALYGYAEEGNGFCTINIDMQKNNMEAYSYLWNKGIYVTKKIAEGKLMQNLGGDMIVKKEFIDEISVDGSKRNIDDYYVFPSFSYGVLDNQDRMEGHDVDVEAEFFKLISEYDKVVITGDHKSGKTTLARNLFRKFLAMGKTALLITASELNRKKIEKTIQYAFCEQYEEENNAYIKFMQMDTEDKVVILDEANLISQKTLDSLLILFKKFFGKIIILGEENNNLDIKKHVVDVMAEKDTLHLIIKPFLYAKRKKLISNILTCSRGSECNVEKETKKLNELINMQVKYFNLNPEFIINFVRQYEKDYGFQFGSGMNVFNMVYESSIRNRIIENAEEIDAIIVSNILRDLAYYMHFQKKKIVSEKEVIQVIEEYAKTYRQKVKISSFLRVAIEAKILDEDDNGICFKDHTIVAYFVAQALNQKYNQGDNIQGECDYLLKNLCFGINSDIILFLAFVTSNPKFVNMIIEGAKKHFEGQEELSFDKGNIKFLLNTTVPTKDTAPDKQEIQRREVELSKREEEEIRLTDLVELVNEYDYSEEDLEKTENQIMISYKYLDILSKTLPAFCQNLKADKQDKIVLLIYKCTNQFLFSMLKDIEDNFDEICTILCDKISSLRREKNVPEVTKGNVKSMLEQISALFIIAIYQNTAAMCTTEQTIDALNEFDYNGNSNYKLQNLMMLLQYGDVSIFFKRSRELDAEMNRKLEKDIIKIAVREFFLRNSVELHGMGQSLMDHFFDENTERKLKMEIAKKKIAQKDRI